MKTYITEEQINEIERVLNQYISPEYIANIKRINKRYGIEFNHDTKTNMQLFYSMVIREIDNLPYTDYWKKDLNRRNLHWNNNDHSKGVSMELLPTIQNYMEIKGYVEDYQYFVINNTTELEDYLSRVEREFKVKLTIPELIDLQPNFKKLLNKFSKQNCDKEAIEQTKNILSIIDKMYGGEFLKVNAVLGTYTDLMIKGKSKEEIFDSIHCIINK
jgi:hypothetical protein